jgi:hypothetical protein
MISKVLIYILSESLTFICENFATSWLFAIHLFLDFANIFRLGGRID